MIWDEPQQRALIAQCEWKYIAGMEKQWQGSSNLQRNATEMGMDCIDLFTTSF